eukprot:4864824-Pleurochrysis_carterae.AAC.2
MSGWQYRRGVTLCRHKRMLARLCAAKCKLALLHSVTYSPQRCLFSGDNANIKDYTARGITKLVAGGFCAVPVTLPCGEPLTRLHLYESNGQRSWYAIEVCKNSSTSSVTLTLLFMNRPPLLRSLCTGALRTLSPLDQQE